MRFVYSYTRLKALGLEEIESFWHVFKRDIQTRFVYSYTRLKAWGLEENPSNSQMGLKASVCIRICNSYTHIWGGEMYSPVVRVVVHLDMKLGNVLAYVIRIFTYGIESPCAYSHMGLICSH